jgi:hypothetical protein
VYRVFLVHVNEPVNVHKFGLVREAPTVQTICEFFYFLNVYNVCFCSVGCEALNVFGCCTAATPAPTFEDYLFASQFNCVNGFCSQTALCRLLSHQRPCLQLLCHQHLCRRPPHHQLLYHQLQYHQLLYHQLRCHQRRHLQLLSLQLLSRRLLSHQRIGPIILIQPSIDLFLSTTVQFH